MIIGINDGSADGDVVEQACLLTSDDGTIGIAGNLQISDLHMLQSVTEPSQPQPHHTPF